MEAKGDVEAASNKNTCMSRAWPLWTGLRSWKAKTASAPRRLNSSCSYIVRAINTINFEKC